MCGARHVGRGVDALSIELHLERAGIASDRLGLDERTSEASPPRLLGSIELAKLLAVASRQSSNHALGSEKPSRPRSSAARLSSTRLIDPIGTITSSGTSSSACGRSVTKP